MKPEKFPRPKKTKLPKYTYITHTERVVDDPYSALCNSINALEKKSYEVFSISLRIDRPKLDDSHITVNGDLIFEYVKYWFGWAPQGRVRVEMICSDPMRRGFWVNGRTLEDWMRTLVQVSPFFDPVQHQDLVSRWWMFMRQHFRFLDLPKELRDMISEYVLFPYEDKIARPYPGSRTPNDSFYPKGEHGVSLLLVNKQVSKEAIEILYKKAKFKFFFSHQLEKFMKRTPAKCLDHIRHIELRMTHCDYVRLFGGPASYFHTHHPEDSLDRDYGCLETFKLNSMQNLEKLVFHITHPAEKFPSLPQQCEVEYMTFCQKEMVDYILDLATVYMYRHHRRVELSGYLRQRQEGRFLARLVKLAHKEDSWVHEIDLVGEDGGGGGTPLRGKTPCLFVRRNRTIELTRWEADYMIARLIREEVPTGNYAVEEGDLYRDTQARTDDGMKVYARLDPDRYVLLHRELDVGYVYGIREYMDHNAYNLYCHCKYVHCSQDELPDQDEWYNGTWGKTVGDMGVGEVEEDEEEEQ